VFYDPSQLRPEAARARVTEQVASEFGKLAESLRDRNVEPQRAAHFLHAAVVLPVCRQHRAFCRNTSSGR